jgi:O-antigen ligase
MMAGFGQTSVTGENVADYEAITSGRTLAWPYVIAKIAESPWIGYGRLAMNRTGLQQQIGIETGDFAFPHPHNMYLETLLDNGIFGSIPIFLFWFIVLIYSAKLFKCNNRLYSAVGGLSLGLTFTSLFAGIGGQHYYPQEHTFGIWGAMFLSLRVYVEEKQALTGETDAERYWSSQPFREQATVASNCL